MEKLELTGTIYERITQAIDFAKKHNKHYARYEQGRGCFF